MRVLYYDIDTLRPDHLGCYGYHRNTSPNIDKVADEGVRFTRCFASDTPCLPSRASMFTGRFGIHTGVVNHGGEAADMKLEGEARTFGIGENFGLIHSFRKAGYYTASISPFAERHAAWWFYEGFNEMINTGKCGHERADEIVPIALDWLDDKGKDDNWFLHVNVWDPHTPYRTPEEYGNPFKDKPAPDWIDNEIIEGQYNSYGPHGARETPAHPSYPRMLSEIRNVDDFKTWIDNYDTGIWYADLYLGKIIDRLKELGIYDDTMIIITSDHGENHGELNVYGDHQTADYITSRVPMIIKVPGNEKSRVDNALHYQCDVGATITELLGGKPNPKWDAKAFTKAFKEEQEEGREYLVVSHCAWSCQRTVIFDDYIMIKTYHDGLKDFPEYMLFDIVKDPHEQYNLAEERPDLIEKGMAYLNEWYDEMMKNSDDGIDPLYTTLKEGGPFHTRNMLDDYCKRLETTGRGHLAKKLKKRHS